MCLAKSGAFKSAPFKSACLSFRSGKSQAVASPALAALGHWIGGSSWMGGRFITCKPWLDAVLVAGLHGPIDEWWEKQEYQQKSYDNA